MTNEEALVGFQNLYNEIDKDNHLFVGTINPEWIQMAIEALENYDGVAEDLQNCLEMYKKKKAEVEALKQNQWIPCSERLPEARRSVIISTKEWTGEGCYWETTPNHIIWKGYRWNATYWDDEVTAWMPLPKPYEGRTE